MDQAQRGLSKGRGKGARARGRTMQHLANELLEVGLPGVELDQLHGRQDFLDDDIAVPGVRVVLLLVEDDQVPEHVLHRHDNADDSHTCTKETQSHFRTANHDGPLL